MTSIVPQLEERQLSQARALAERTKRRELLAIVESAEMTKELEAYDFDEALAELARLDDPEAADTAARLRCVRALLACTKGDETAGFAEWEAVLAEHPTLSLPYVTRGRWWLQNAETPDRALDDFERAVAVDPKDASAYFWRGRCFEVRGDSERALANYRRAAGLDRDAIDLQHAFAKALSEQELHDEALPVWSRLVAMGPGYVDFWLGRADEYEATEQYEAALADYDRALALDPESHSVRFARALCLSHAERVAEAVDEMQKVNAADPDKPLYLRALGDLLTRNGRPDLAIAPLTRALELEPSPEGVAARARAYAALGDAERALAEFDRAVAIDPFDDGAALDRLNLLMKHFPPEQVKERVLAEVERLAERMPASGPLAKLQAQVLLERAIGNARLERVQAAFDDASRAIELDPSCARAWIARGVYRTGLDHDAALAIADLDRAVQLAPDDPAAHFQRGQVLRWMGDSAGALAECDRAIALAPAVGQLYWERAGLRRELEDAPAGWEEENLADYDRALEHGYRDPDVFFHKAVMLESLGRLEAAIATLDDAAEEMPKEGWIYHWRGEYKSRLGDRKGARADRARAKRLGFVFQNGADA